MGQGLGLIDVPVHAGGRGNLVADDGWNTVPISKGNRPIDTSRLTKITKVRGSARPKLLGHICCCLEPWLGEVGTCLQNFVSSGA